jgi:hypothetical protein
MPHIIYGCAMGWASRAGLLLAVGLVAAAAGFAMARDAGPGEHRAAVAAPVPAQPDLPVDPSTPPAADIDYPTLQPGLTYAPETLGHGAFTWDYAVPAGWRRYGAEDGLGPNELRWRPPDEPTVGGFSVRVKLVNSHQTAAQMVAAKLAALRDGPDSARSFPGFTVLDQSDDTLAFSYRVPSSQTLRYNTFRWVTPPGGHEVGVEMSVVGRERDRAGLSDLLARVSDSFRPR